MLSAAIGNTQAIQLNQNFCDRSIQCGIHRLAEAAARLVAPCGDPHEQHIWGRDCKEFGAEQRIHQCRRVRIHTYRRSVAHDIRFAIEQQGSRNRSGIMRVDRIDQDDGVFPEI